MTARAFSFPAGQRRRRFGRRGGCGRGKARAGRREAAPLPFDFRGVASERDADAKRRAGAFLFIILFEQLSQLARLDADDRIAAGVEADRAQVSQATINLAYTRIIAPFDGVVTSRAVDVGNLVTVGTPGTTPLFTVADQTKLRLYVRVPQNYAPYIQDGMSVNFTVPQYPGRTFQAKLVASAGAVASATGTILVQFSADNVDGALQPGAYAEVKFPLPAGANGIRVPATALIFRDEGMQVATVDATNHVKLKTVKISRDLGASVDVSTGISETDRIIDNPADALQDGDLVRVTK